jgi:hypothetical protein
MDSPAGDGQSEFAHLQGVVQRFGERDGDWLWNRFTVHYTPKHGSWLNQTGIELSLFSPQGLGQRRIPRLAACGGKPGPGTGINRDEFTIDWRFTCRKARRKFNYGLPT